MKRVGVAWTRVWFLLPLLILATGCLKSSWPSPQSQVTPATGQQGDASTTQVASIDRVAGSQELEEETLGKHQLLHKTNAVNRPLAAPLPRKTSYNGLRFTVTKE